MFRKLTYLMMLILIGVGSAFGQTTHNMSETWRTSDGLASLVTIDKNLLQYKAENTLGTVNIEINGTPYNSFETAVAAITEQFETSTTTNFPTSNVTGTTVVNLSSTTATLTANRSISGTLVVVGSGKLTANASGIITVSGSLILQGDVILDGGGSNTRNKAFIQVTGGKLYMAENATIQNCVNNYNGWVGGQSVPTSTNLPNFGGAVYVSGNGAQLNMAGGVIGDASDDVRMNVVTPSTNSNYQDPETSCAMVYSLTSPTGNKAPVGGGVFMYTGNNGGGNTITANLNGGIIKGNQSTKGGNGAHCGGGGLMAWGANATVNIHGDTEISYNLSTAGAGVNMAFASALNIDGGLFKWNCAALDDVEADGRNMGGGVRVTSGQKLNITGGEFTENRSPNCGTALYIFGDAKIDISGVNVHHNYGCGYGAIYVEAAAANILSGKIHDNVASWGGAVVCSGTTAPGYGTNYTVVIGNNDGTGPEIYNNKVLYNLKPWNDEFGGLGGAIYLYQLNLEVKGGHMYNNEAEIGGGFAFIEEANCTLSGGNIGIKPDNAVIGNKAIGVNALLNDDPYGVNGDGGAIYVMDYNETGKKTTIGGTVNIAGNTAVRNGGGLYIYSGEVDITGGTFDGNQALGTAVEMDGSRGGNGGGMYVESSIRTDMTGGTLINNVAANNGGGLYLKSTFNMTGGSFGTSSSDGNIATNGNGGGVYVDSNTTGNALTVSSGTFSGNKAEAGNGGGFYVAKGNVSLQKGSGTGNAINVSNGNTAINGGGFYVNNGNVTLKDANIASNVATGNGGGVYSNGGEFTISNTSSFTGGILSNSAANGGGGYVNGGTLEITGGNIDNNSVSANGGGFYVNGGTLNLYGGIIGQTDGNDAVRNGGGFYLKGGVANIQQGTGGTSATVQYNTAANGAGIYMEGTDSSSKAVANFEDGTIQNNETTSGSGGGIYLANFSELKMSGASTITGNHVPAGYKGGGVYKQGGTNTLLWVSGSSLQIVDNYAGTSSSRSNAYLNSYDDYITIDDEEGVSDQVKVGISVNVTDTQTDLPTPVLYCADTDLLNDVFYMLKHPNGDNGVFDDASRYVAVYQSRPEPFNDHQIFFIATWVAEVTEPEDFDNTKISTPQELAWFMVLVNGLNGQTAQPGLQGNVLADIDMSDFYWTPIGEWDHNDSHYNDPSNQPVYIGTFDGNGHTISGLNTCGIIGYFNYGMFGHTGSTANISNVVLADCDFVSGETSRMGNLIAEMDGGTVENCIVSGSLNPSGSETIEDDEHSCVVGGLIGEAKDNAVIRNCITTADIEATAKTGSIYPGMQAYTVGGLVGMTSAGTVIENCFANPEIHHSGANGSNTTLTSWDRFVGGLIGENNGIVRNCYVRLQRGNQLTTTQSGGNRISKFGMFAGLNNGTINDCFYPNSSLRNANITAYGADLYYTDSQLGTSTGHGQYNAVTRPYTYTSYLKDNQVMMDGESAYGTTEATTLLGKLNAWATTNGSNYSHWMRTKASDVNADYPVLSYDNIISTLNYTVVGSKDGIRLEYDNSFNDIYDRFAAETEKEGCLFVYRTPWSGTISSPASEIITADNSASGNSIKVFVEDGVALLQDADSKLVRTYTCQEFNDASRSWHLISSSLNGDSPIGFSYIQNAPYNEDPNPCGARFVTGDYASFLPQGITMTDLDLYCFYEPEYHWINFKRNSSSHWHMNDQHQNIAYSNETSLVPGKGYLASFAGRTFLQAGGELTSGDVNLPVTFEAGSHNASATPTAIPANEGTELKGYNLLANPYQSYLNLAAFLTVNSGLFSGSSKSGALIPTYAVYDPEKGAYVQGMASTPSRGSYAPTGTLGMHEGFFIVAANSGKSAKFTNAMRLDKATSSAKRAEQPAYPLVNLMVADASGDSDIAVVEFGRPQVEGAAKMMNIGANGKVYFHYNGDDCALLYLDDATDQLPVHFDAIADGTYTMTWRTANATFSYLHLIDNMTGMDIDMLASDGYTFTSNSSDYKSRFKMMFAYTGVEENEAAESETFAFMHDGNLTVNGEGWLEVIDMCGRTIASSRLTDAQSTVSLPNAASGLYVLKLTNDNRSKVQKIVVR